MTGRYARVKAVLTGDGTVTPTLEELRLDFVGEVSSRSARYVYDEAGNLTHRVASLGGSVTEETRVYNNLNELVSNVIDDGAATQTWTFSYDDNGNLVQRSNGTETHVYTWDEDNRLVAVEVNGSNRVTYQYDSSSRLLQRVEGGTTTNYIWDGWDLLREEKSGAVTETTDYLCPAGEVLAFQRDGDWYYLHGDGLSSTQLMTDASGAVVGRYVYGAWGDELVASESVPGVFENRFVGGLGCRRDSATGLVYMRHRWYDATLQRFISRDPIGLWGGVHRYRYANNRPTMEVDASGLNPGFTSNVDGPCRKKLTISWNRLRGLLEGMKDCSDFDVSGYLDLMDSGSVTFDYADSSPGGGTDTNAYVRFSDGNTINFTFDGCFLLDLGSVNGSMPDFDYVILHEMTHLLQNRAGDVFPHHPKKWFQPFYKAFPMNPNYHPQYIDFEDGRPSELYNDSKGCSK